MRGTYHYEAQWIDTGGHRVTWSAKVTYGGELRGTLNGTMEPMSAPRMIESIRVSVDRSIEALLGIVE